MLKLLIMLSLSIISFSLRNSLKSKQNIIKKLYSGGKIRDGMGIAKGYANNINRYILEKHTLSGLPNAISSNNNQKSFIVLGIESSCDDTGVAIVRSDGKILSNAILSQVLIN